MSANLENANHYTSRKNSHSEKLYHTQRYSKFKSSSKFPENFDLPDTGTGYDASTSVADKSNSSLQFG